MNSVERVARAFDRIDPELGAFITLNGRAGDEARSDPAGPLRGVILGVKDLIDTAGIRTTYGSADHFENTPERDAPIVESMRNKGALILGKTNLNEYAYGVTGFNPHFGAMLTPSDRSRTAGGSSGGSAIAVATGVCDLALGTDTSGSVRIPAACCNVYGFKVANGESQLAGIFPLAPSLDSIGFLSADVETLELALNVKRFPSMKNLRVARLGHDLMLPALPDEHWVGFRAQAREAHLKDAGSNYGSDVRLKLRSVIGDTSAARTRMNSWTADVTEELKDVHILESAVFPGDAPSLSSVMLEYQKGMTGESERLMSFTPVANALGWPAMVVPTAEKPRHLLARPGAESVMLSYAASIGLDRAEVLERNS